MKNKLKKTYLSIFRTKSIFTQLVLFTFIVSLVPILFISSLLFLKINNLVTKDLVDSHNQLAAQYTSNLENKFVQYSDSLKQIANNTIVLSTLMDKSDKNPYIKGNEVSIEVNKSLHLDSNNELRNCMIYSNIGNSKIYGTRAAMLDGASREIWYLNNKALDEDYFIYSALDGKSTILSLIQNIIYIDTKNFQRQYVGFIKLDILMERLFAPTRNVSTETYFYDVIVMDKEENIVYSSNKSYNDILENLTFSQLQNENINYYKDAMICTNVEDNYELKLIFLFNYSQLSTKKSEMKRAILPVLIIIFCIIIATSFAFTRGFSKRVSKLINKIKIAETGDLTITEEIKGNDEIAILDKQFNHMLIKLDNLIHKNYIQQLEKKETEFQNLKLQINPHFLYNTLETISSIAATKQVFMICELCEKLGENFRYSLGKNYGEYVSILQELQHTKNYIYIQKTRFGNKFEVFYHMEPGLEEKLILRFILQPIVENAIVHGLSKSPGNGTLEISISRVEEKLVIKIEDDGIGMAPDKVDEIRSYIDDYQNSGNDRNHSIGIRNVNQRIKLACGNEYGITIESTQYRGSCFIITLPMMQ
ncbi:MAG: ypdA 10 [Herbinix sp.]|jgi:sensor histidine kinase YesM|nr:ypdA 10 [Herbinix sp.]